MMPKAFFSVPMRGSCRQRLLLISFHFAPSTAAGALRWQKMAQLAAEDGWCFDVITCDPAFLARRDDRMLAELPPGTRVYGVAPATFAPDRIATRASALLRSARSARHVDGGDRIDDRPSPGGSAPASLTRNDARWSLSFQTVRRLYNAWSVIERERRWARAATKLALRLIEQGDAPPYTAVVTCGPPHMPHRCGTGIHTRTGIPHVMDLRDPWSLVERLPESWVSPLWFSTAERAERRCVASAARIVMNTEPAAEAMRRRYPQLAHRIVAVTNGFDDAELAPPAPRSRFVVVYAGSLYLDRDPRLLFRAAAGLIRSRGLPPERFAMEFIGAVEELDGVPLHRIAEEEGIASHIHIRPPMPRAELIEHLHSASMLVILPQDSRLAIPSKAYEYMLFHAWILALAEPESATGKLFAGLNADLVHPLDEREIRRVLEKRFAEFEQGQLPPRLADDPRHGRRRQTQLFFRALQPKRASAHTSSQATAAS